MFLVVTCMLAGGILAWTYGTDALMALARSLRVPAEEMESYRTWTVHSGLTMVGALAGAILGAEISIFLSYLGRQMEEMETEEKINAIVGIAIGILISLAFYPILLRISVVGPFLAMLVTLVSVFLVVAGVNSVKEGLPWSSKPASRRRNIHILDTNVIIDGRIGEIAKTGFLSGQIYVPGFVLDELQAIADSADPLRRARGRRGLDILKAMQKELDVEVRTQDRLAPPAGDEVDARLVRLAKAMNCDIVTNDFNLSKVAELEGVRVLNVNDLALAMKPNVLPGETMTVTLQREGKEPGQGVGYLDDGTMVVVEGGAELLGNTLQVCVTSVIQTVAGKMIFATPDREEVGDGYDARGSSGRRQRRSF